MQNSDQQIDPGRADRVDFPDLLAAEDIAPSVLDLAVRYVFAPLNEIEYWVLALVRFDHLSQRETAEAISKVTGSKLSRDQVQRIQARALRKLREQAHDE